ncbi:swarming motility protein ybiA [Trifolium medium]|uniref:Swarming motility protein ybiA n=1 Tax=Trifolium medium TaxID=97028 RepID=A0A392MD29_9FABA|nr:swarming motility protein ybiA [Trifolium medium]
MDELSPANQLEMVIPVFDGEIDAYWWVLCIEKYFKHWRTPETLKMIVAGLAMKGPALTWWLRWYPRHPWVNWDAFTSIILWHFKPEWRVMLSIPDDEEELVQDLEQSVNVDAEFSTIGDDFGKSHHETCPEESSTVNSISEENQTQILTPPKVFVNAFAMTTEMDESQIQNNMQRKIGNKINCVSSTSLKPQPLSNPSPNSFHLSLSRERLGFSMTAEPAQPTSFNLGLPKQRSPSSTVTLPWFEPPPPEPPDRSCSVLAADNRTSHFESKVVADNPGILNKDARGHSNVKVILPMCNSDAVRKREGLASANPITRTQVASDKPIR